jgi:hypothetical protein
MNKSQLKSLGGALATALGVLDAHMDVLTAVLPPKYAGWLRAGVIFVGVVLMLFNQSWHPSHTSIPIEKAQALGLVEVKK